MKIVIALLIALVTPMAMAQDGDFDARVLLRSCKDAGNFSKAGRTTEPLNVMQCVAYIRGVTEGYNAVLEVTPVMDRVYCLPASMDYYQISKVVAAYMTNNAAHLKQYTPASMVLAALRDTYPCDGAK